MKNIVTLLYVFILGPVLYVHASSVEGCTFASYGIQQCEIKFISTNMCIVSQINRISGETSVDTLEYAIKGNYISISAKYSYDEISNKDRKSVSTKYRVDPYVYLDGKPIRNHPLGGSSAVLNAFPTSFVRKNIGVFLPLNDVTVFELLTPNIMIIRKGDGIYDLYKLTLGKARYNAGNPQYHRMVREFLKHFYIWGYYWFMREKYEGQPLSTLSGHRYEYASYPINESLQFLNDTSCVYTILSKDTKASIEYYCNYSLLPDGGVIVRTDSSVFASVDVRVFIPEPEKYLSKDALLLSIPTINCDTFFMCGDILYYSKLYPIKAYACYNNDSVSLNPDAHLLQTKAFVRSGKKKSLVKIAKMYQKYVMPINYTRSDE